MNLFQISEKYNDALNTMSEMDDLPSEVIADTMESIVGEFEDKAKAVTSFICNMDADIETLKAHSKSISARISSLNKKKEGLREYLKYNMQKTGITKVSSPYFSVSIGKPSKLVCINDESLIPDTFFKVTRSPVKTEIAKSLKAGEEVGGATLVDGEPRLTIKVG